MKRKKTKLTLKDIDNNYLSCVIEKLSNCIDYPTGIYYSLDRSIPRPADYFFNVKYDIITDLMNEVRYEERQLPDKYKNRKLRLYQNTFPLSTQWEYLSKVMKDVPKDDLPNEAVISDLYKRIRDKISDYKDEEFKLFTDWVRKYERAYAITHNSAFPKTFLKSDGRFIYIELMLYGILKEAKSCSSNPPLPEEYLLSVYDNMVKEALKTYRELNKVNRDFYRNEELIYNIAAEVVTLMQFRLGLSTKVAISRLNEVREKIINFAVKTKLNEHFLFTLYEIVDLKYAIIYDVFQKLGIEIDYLYYEGRYTIII